MDEAGQEAGVFLCFQQLVKAFWLEERSEGQRKRKEEGKRGKTSEEPSNKMYGGRCQRPRVLEKEEVEQLRLWFPCVLCALGCSTSQDLQGEALSRCSQ